MFLFKKPTSASIASSIQRLASAPFSYEEQGGTRQALTPGYNQDFYEVLLGKGEQVFAKASQRLKAWEMFHTGWTDLVCNDASIAVGSTVAILIKVAGLFWSLNFSRVVYILEQDTEAMKIFGFAYGTLSDHAEKGEEQFLVEWDKKSDEVYYRIRSFSRPNNFFVWLFYPYGRVLQRRFGRDSLDAMKRAVN